MSKLEWIAPHLDMAFAPIPHPSRTMLKIIRTAGRFNLHRQDDDGMTLIDSFATLAEAKAAANKFASDWPN